MSTIPVAKPETCIVCSGVIPAGSAFCPLCGTPNLSATQRAQVDGYVRAAVSKALDERLRSEDGVVRELADKAENVVWKRFWIYTVLFGLLGAILAWFGYSSFRSITDSAKNRVEPIVKDAVDRASQARSDVMAMAGEVKDTKDKIDNLSREADEQKKRLDTQSGDASRKLAQLQESVDRANKTGENYESKVNALTQRLESQYSRAETGINNQAIAVAYPNIDTEPFVMVGGKRIDGSKKKPGEIWVVVNLSAYAINRHILTSAKLEKMLHELEEAGFTPFLGDPVAQGRVVGSPSELGTGDYNQSHVYYFDNSKKDPATKLQVISSKFVEIKDTAPTLVTFPGTPNYNQNVNKIIVEKSGIDAQVFISCPPQ